MLHFLWSNSLVSLGCSWDPDVLCDSMCHSPADWRPPKGSDGTPHESVADVLVRGRQVLSICETQYR